MAYAAVGNDAPVKVVRANDRRVHYWRVTETEAATGDEFELSPVPPVGTIVIYQATLTAGTGTTINPALGYATGFSASTQNHLSTNSTTAAHINDQTSLRYVTAAASQGSLFVKSTPNDATADHTVVTMIAIVEGHI